MTVALSTPPSIWRQSAARIWPRANGEAGMFVRNVSATLIVRFALTGIGIATSVMIARLLGPEGRGIYAAATVFATVASQFGLLGLQTSATYYVARDRALLPALLSNSMCVTLVGGGAICTVLALIFRLRPNWAPVGGMALSAALLLIPMTLGSLLSQNLLLGIQEVKWYNIAEVTGRVAFIAACWIAALHLGRLRPAQMAFIATSAAFVTFALATARLLFVTRRLAPPDLSLFHRQLAYGVRPYLVCLAGYLVLKIDILMVKYLAGATATGYYSLASGMADFLNSVPGVVGMMLFPVLAATVDLRQRWARTRKAMAYLAAIMALAVLLASVCAAPLTRALYGEAFLPAVPAFLVLCIAIAFYGMSTMISIYFSASGQPWFTVALWPAAALLNIGLNLYLIPARGIAGAAWASLITYSALLIAQYAYATNYPERHTYVTSRAEHC